jgi:anti-sigma factor RsiW
MNCRKAQRFLALYAGGELSGRRAKAVRPHLEKCAVCRAETAEYKAALERAKTLAAEEATLDWTDAEWRRTMTAITAEPVARSGRRALSINPALAAAAAFLLVVLGTQYAVRYLLRTSEITTARAPAVTESRLPSDAAFDHASLAAVAKIAGLEDARFPVLTSTKQDVPVLTLISPETGIKIIWFINDNLEMED